MVACQYCESPLGGAIRCESCGAHVAPAQLAALRQETSPRKHPLRWLVYGVLGVILAPIALPFALMALAILTIATDGWGLLLLGGYLIYHFHTRRKGEKR